MLCGSMIEILGEAQGVLVTVDQRDGIGGGQDGEQLGKAGRREEGREG